MKKFRVCMVELDMCFPKNTKIGMLHGILGLQNGGSDTLTISGLQHQHLNVCKACECWIETWSSTENATTK